MYRKGHIHFVGIGGIGMSGIAKILKSQGYTISGCDSDLEQKSVTELISLGCQVHKGNNTPQCHDDSIDVLVYSSAIAKITRKLSGLKSGVFLLFRVHSCLQKLCARNLVSLFRELMAKLQRPLLLPTYLIEAHKDPTVIVGGHLKNISSNARWGNGDFLDCRSG